MANHTQTPSKGRIIFVRPTAQTPPGSDEVPAIITHVGSDDIVSATVFPNGGGPFTMASMKHCEIDEENPPAGMVWRWPPRV